MDFRFYYNIFKTISFIYLKLILTHFLICAMIKYLERNIKELGFITLCAFK